MAFFNTLKTKLQIFNKKVDDYQEAITFAEAGIQAGEQAALSCAETRGRNVVVATHESRFSDDMMLYALEMAGRMNYGIIAVNAASITHDITEFFSTTHDKLFADFKETATRNAEAFRTRALDQGLKFAHTVHASDLDHAVAAVAKECGEIEFIISENREPARARGVIGNEKRIAQRLCVYSMN
nr:universal stress protein [Desulfobacula sp.]